MNKRKALFVVLPALLLLTGCGPASTGGSEAIRPEVPHGDATSTSLPRTPLHAAARTGDTILARSLIAHGADVNACDWAGCTPLHHAAEREHTAIAKLLLRNGARVDAVNYLEQTPLHLAARAGCDAMVDLLITAGADLNVKD